MGTVSQEVYTEHGIYCRCDCGLMKEVERLERLVEVKSMAERRLLNSLKDARAALARGEGE